MLTIQGEGDYVFTLAATQPEWFIVMCSGIRKSYTGAKEGLLLKVQLLQIRFKVININSLIFGLHYQLNTVGNGRT